jgi:glutathione S-transferase
MRLWGSNLIVEFLMKTHPDNGEDAPRPPLSATMTRADRHWQDAKILATLETITDTIMNLRQIKMSGYEPEQITYLRRQRERIDRCLDWLEKSATPDGFIP